MKVIKGRKVMSDLKQSQQRGQAKKRKFSCPDVELRQSTLESKEGIPKTGFSESSTSVNKHKQNPAVLRRRSMPTLGKTVEDLKPAPRAVSFSPEILLHSAIMENNAEELAKLLKTKLVDINQPNSHGRLPIHEAASEGHVECAQVLIENGAVLTAESKDGVSPLEAAVYGGNFECAELLIKSGAPIDKIRDGFVDPIIEKQTNVKEMNGCCERVELKRK